MAIRSNENRPVGKLKPHPKNVRIHSKKQISEIAENIKTICFTNPIIIDETNTILSGHARLAAAKLTGMQSVPVVVLKGLTDAQKRVCVLAENRLADKAGYDFPALAVELSDLRPILGDTDLKIENTGFEPAEIDGLLGDLVDPEVDPADEVIPLESQPVTRASDLWQLNNHRIICGDAKLSMSYRELMGRERADAVFTDIPYNVRIRDVQGRGRIKHREFMECSGEKSREEFTNFLTTCLSQAAKHSKSGSLHYIFMDWRHAGEIIAAGEQVYTECKNLIVWNKTNAGQGSLYRSQHELIWLFKNGTAPHRNNVELGRHGRNRSNVWTYPGSNTFRAGRMDDLAAHPTSKPVKLIVDALRDCTARGDLVLDCFLGAGSTILAAEQVGRRACGIEIDPLYVDCAIRRWQQATKRDAILTATGHTFDEVAAARCASSKLRAK